MNRRQVLVIQTGVANTASVLAGLERAGATPRLAVDPAEIAAADRVVLPGVGAFGPAAQRLREMALNEVLSERIAAERPTLAVCLGLQLWCTSSDEAPTDTGLGAVAATVERIPEAAGGERVRVPQLGWNRVAPDPECVLIEEGWAYFAHSYRLAGVPAGWSVARTNYAGEYVSAVEHGPLLACQFHPELSGAWGTALLARWIEMGGRSC